MKLVRIREVAVVAGYRLRLTLTDDTVVERDVEALLVGPVFERLRADPAEFARVAVQDGSLIWPGGADLCPDVVIWSGSPPQSARVRAA